MSESKIKLTKDGYIATITFCDPSGLNLLDTDVVMGLAKIQDEIAQEKFNLKQVVSDTFCQ